MDALGGSALIIIIAKIVYEIVQERRTRASAKRLAEGNNRGNPRSALDPGSSSANLMLHIIDEHTKEIQRAFTNIEDIKKSLTQLSVKVARIEGQLTRGG